MQEVKTTMRLHHPSLPIDLHRRIKIAAAGEYMKLKDWVEKVLLERVDKDGIK